MLPFRLHFEDGKPVSDQLVQAVRRAILANELGEMDPFPSIRALSQELRISPTTAHKAVAQLKAEGLLASRPGIGMVVRTDALPSQAERLNHLNSQLVTLATEAQALGLDFSTVAEAFQETWTQQQNSPTAKPGPDSDSNSEPTPNNTK